MDKVKIGFPIEYEDGNNIVRNGIFLREPEIKELEKRLKEINKITDLKQKCKKQKEIINKAIEYINDNLIISSILDGKKYYTISDYSFDYRELLDILNEGKKWVRYGNL